MGNKDYNTQMLNLWEQVFQKGQLTFWILVSLKESKKSLEEIQQFISFYTKGVVSFDEQSIYRALRKYYEVELIDYELRDSPKGPQRKYYALTNTGRAILKKFTDRNIMIFQSAELQKILNI